MNWAKTYVFMFHMLQDTNLPVSSFCMNSCLERSSQLFNSHFIISPFISSRTVFSYKSIVKNHANRQDCSLVMHKITDHMGLVDPMLYNQPW